MRYKCLFAEERNWFHFQPAHNWWWTLCLVWVVLFCWLSEICENTHFYKVVLKIATFSLPATSCFEEVHEICLHFSATFLLICSFSGFLLQAALFSKWRHTHSRTLSFTHNAAAIWLLLHRAETRMWEYIAERTVVSVFLVTHNGLYLCENACGSKRWPLCGSTGCI